MPQQTVPRVPPLNRTHRVASRSKGFPDLCPSVIAVTSTTSWPRIKQSTSTQWTPIAIIAQAQPKRDYYYQSRLGNRLFDLDLGPIALAFAAAGTPEDQRAIDRVLRESGVAEFPPTWLRHRGMSWAADLLEQHRQTLETHS